MRWDERKKQNVPLPNANTGSPEPQPALLSMCSTYPAPMLNIKDHTSPLFLCILLLGKMFVQFFLSLGHCSKRGSWGIDLTLVWEVDVCPNFWSFFHNVILARIAKGGWLIWENSEGKCFCVRPSSLIEDVLNWLKEESCRKQASQVFRRKPRGQLSCGNLIQFLNKKWKSVAFYQTGGGSYPLIHLLSKKP